ncbi:MAG: ATP-binding protein [Armatimonadota bacterium]|nr:ATP-binding protein [bacterium]
MSIGVDSITTVSVKSCPDYLSHLRLIMSCVADSVGMDQQEADEARLAVTEACVNAIKHGSPRGSDDVVMITLKTSEGTITVDVTDNGCLDEDQVEKSRGLGVGLMKKLADSVQFVKHKTGLTVRLTKRAKNADRVVASPSQMSRN